MTLTYLFVGPDLAAAGDRKGLQLVVSTARGAPAVARRRGGGVIRAGAVTELDPHRSATDDLALVRRFPAWRALPRQRLTTLPTPVQRLERLGRQRGSTSCGSSATT